MRVGKAKTEARRPTAPRGHGPHVVAGTVLARAMNRRRMRKTSVAAALNCSDRALYNYMTHKRPLPVQKLARLCDLLDMDPDELIDDQGFLLEA